MGIFPLPCCDWRPTQVSTASPERREHVVCVYTCDYLDRAEVEGVRAGLRASMAAMDAAAAFTGRMVYKPDVYTYLGIYAGAPPTADRESSSRV